MILRGKKFVLIGVGLIGSHTAEELIKEDIKASLYLIIFLEDQWKMLKIY